MKEIVEIEEIVKDGKDDKDRCEINKNIRETLDKLVKMDRNEYKTSLLLSKTLMNIHRQEKINNRGVSGYKGRSLLSKRDLGIHYRHLIKHENYPYIDELYHVLMLRAVRSESGIVNVSVVMPGDTFSCKYNCKFCPNEPGMPRSYLRNEDAVSRANENGFDPVKQIYSRLRTLENNGHFLDKIEIRILGGTFSCYQHSVAYDFVRKLYYAANTYYDDFPRDVMSMEEEQQINTYAKIHVVGMGVETRPDEINENELIRFRSYGITRVELGVQHTDNDILKTVQRGHTVEDSKRATKLLKDYGFKIEIHIMADLPGSTPEKDKKCYLTVFNDPDLTPDYMKDYPCLDVAFTEIREWKEDGRWLPYSEYDNGSFLMDVLVYRQLITPKWVRVNRIQRDFRPEHSLGFSSETIKTNLAMIVKEEAEKQGVYCQCIRCCEIRDESFDEKDIVYTTYRPSSQEYFIAAEIKKEPRNLLLGFIRLRLPDRVQKKIRCLDKDTALIRELHIYGKVKPLLYNKNENQNKKGAQHLGIGRTLLSLAETICQEHHYTKVAVISGIGVRDYYQKNGYKLNDTYMVKLLNTNLTNKLLFLLFYLFCTFCILYNVQKIY